MTYPQAVAANINAGKYTVYEGIDILQELSAMSYVSASRAVTMALIRINGCELVGVK